MHTQYRNLIAEYSHERFETYLAAAVGHDRFDRVLFEDALL